MLVGQTMGGKTSVVKTLARALEIQDKWAVDKTDSTEGPMSVLVHSINPKSVSIGQLYGDFEKVSRDW